MLPMPVYLLHNLCVSPAVIYNKEAEWSEWARAVLKLFEEMQQPISKLLLHSKESAVADLLSAFQEFVMWGQTVTHGQADVRMHFNLLRSHSANPGITPSNVTMCRPKTGCLPIAVLVESWFRRIFTRRTRKRAFFFLVQVDAHVLPSVSCQESHAH